ncbi:MAG: T9SS type A sorting domain-containing protein [Bacteroidota bacterium]
MRKNVFAIVLMIVCINLFGQTPGDNDSTFNSKDLGYFNGEGVINGNVYASLIQPDGKILIAGVFTAYNTYGGSSIARILPNGLIDKTFLVSGVFYNPIYALALQPDGKILIGGSFTSCNGTAINSLARLNSDGTLDLSFNPGAGPNYTVSTIALQPDGKMIIGGRFTTYNNISTNYLTRVNSNGSIDTSFHIGVGPNSVVNAAAVQSDGKILIGGYFTTYNGVSSNRITRINTNGSIDTSFHVGTGANGIVNAITLQNDGKILIGGEFMGYNNLPTGPLTRINPNGTNDAGFSKSVWSSAIVDAITVDSNNSVFVGGINLVSNHTAIKVNSNGSLDSIYSLPNFIYGRIKTVSLQQDGKLFIGGDISYINGDYVRRIARINTNGTIDKSFNYRTAANSGIVKCAIQPDQKILIGGNFTAYNNKEINRISRLNGDGSIDTSFLTSGTYGGANGVVNTISLQSDNKIIVGGDFTTFHSGNCKRLIRLLPSGLEDSTFNFGNFDGAIYATAVQPDGKIIVAGNFINANSASVNRIVRLNADGTTDLSFNPGSGANNIIYELALQADGKILIVGSFTTFNGTSRNRVARLNTNGTLDLTFSPGTGANNVVTAIALQADGKIIIGGTFTSYNGVSKGRLARLSSTGVLETNYNPGTGCDALVWSISFQADGKAIIGGGFGFISGNAAYNLSRFNINGTIDSTFLVQNFGGTQIFSTAIQNDGKIIAAGSLSIYNGVGRNNIARVLVDCGPPVVLNSSSYQELNICNGKPTVLRASATGTITWYSSSTSTVVLATGNSYTTPVLGAGSFTYYAEAFSCMRGTSRTPFIVQVNSTPVINVNSATICPNSSLTLIASGGTTYTWSTGTTSQSIIITPTVTTTYTATGTDVNGCTNTAISSVTVNSVPSLTLSSPSIEINCLFSSVDCSASGASTYTWSGTGIISGVNSNSVTVNSPGTYSVTGSNGLCTSTSTVAVVTNTVMPTPGAISSGSITCNSPTITIQLNTSSSPVNCDWNGMGIISGANTFSPTVNSAGIYNYTLTNTANGCINTGSTAVYSDTSTPVFSVTPTTSTLTCTSQTATIFAQSNDIDIFYSWSTGVSNSNTLNVSSMGTYSCTATNTTTGCSAVESFNVMQDVMAPLVTIGASSYSICVGSSSNLTSTVASPSLISYAWSTGEGTANIIVTPTVTETYTLNVTDNINGCISTETISLTVDNTCADIWPGDANSDGTADNLDVLELGVHYTQTGAARASISNNWQSYFANNWAGTITNGKNVNHSDCNGDGTINDDDTLAIYNNYGLTHAFKTAQTTTVNPQLSIVPDQPMVVKGMWGTASVYLGDATNAINNINGLAFTVDFDNTMIEPSVWLEYINSFIDASQNLHFQKSDFANGKIFIASTHTVSNNVSGYGKIATLHYQIKSNLLTDEILTIGVSQCNQSDASGAITPLTSGTGTVMAIGASVGIHESLMTGNILISPNPTKGLIVINSTNDLQYIEVTTIAGQVLLKQNCVDKSHQVQLQNFAEGVYFVKVVFVNGTSAVRKIVVNR